MYSQIYIIDVQNRIDITSILLFQNVPLDPAENTLFSITQNVVININDIQNLPPNIDKDTLTFTMREDHLPVRNSFSSHFKVRILCTTSKVFLIICFTYNK